MTTKIITLSLLLMFVTFEYCNGQSQAKFKDYKIERIKSLRHYYVLYASRNDSIFKIVSKKESISRCVKIRKGKIYGLILYEIPFSGDLVDCIAFDRKTVICRENRYGYSLFMAGNLKGLCWSR